jgi:uncharacterized repeat protein (TIGR01451 family)
MMKPFKSIWSGLITGMIVGLAAVLPVMTSAESKAALQGSLTAANVTAGDKDYKDSLKAASDDVVKLQAYYQNSGGNGADNVSKLRVKVALPTQAGKSQTVSLSLKGDNTDELKDQLVVTADRDDAMLQYVPGSAVWKHNTADQGAAKIEDTKLSDEVVSGAQGIVLGDIKPGQDNAGTVSVLVRVMLPNVKISTESQLQTDSNKWSANNTAKPGDSLKYIVSYQNTSSQQQKQVVLRDTLPAQIHLQPGTTTLYNTNNPKGLKLNSDDIAGNGVNIGNYGAGANAYVVFQAKVADAADLVCGNNGLRSVSGAKPEGQSEYFNSAITSVNKDCSITMPTTPDLTPMQPVTPTSSCDQLTVTKTGDRKISAKVDYTAKDGAKLKTVTYNFGDGSQPLVTDKTTVDYTYTKDGDYTVAATLVVGANGKDQTVTSATCAKPVNFSPPSASPPVTTPAPAKDGGLPSTGPGNIIGLFLGATTIGFVGHRLVLSRRFVR